MQHSIRYFNEGEFWTYSSEELNMRGYGPNPTAARMDFVRRCRKNYMSLRSLQKRNAGNWQVHLEMQRLLRNYLVAKD